MARNHAVIATRMSWILLFAAIALTGACATDPILCGDDVGYIGGADIEVTGLEPGLSYDLTVETAGETVVLARTPEDLAPQARVALADGRELDAYMVQQGGESARLVAALLQEEPDVLEETTSRVGPSPITVVVSTGGAELARETFTPAYTRSFNYGPECPFHDYAGLTMTVPAPP